MIQVFWVLTLLIILLTCSCIAVRASWRLLPLFIFQVLYTIHSLAFSPHTIFYIITDRCYIHFSFLTPKYLSCYTFCLSKDGTRIQKFSSPVAASLGYNFVHNVTFYLKENHLGSHYLQITCCYWWLCVVSNTWYQLPLLHFLTTAKSFS